jgi:hypothetical protein
LKSLGVINPQAISQYIGILGIDEQIGDVPEILKGFYNTCALAGPTKCAVAAQYPTADAIEGAVDQLLETTFKTWNAGTGQTSYNQLVLQGIFSILYTPGDWDTIAQGLAFGLNGSLTESTAILKAKSEEKRFKWPYLPNLYSSPGSVWEAGLKRDLEKRQLINAIFTGYLWNINYTLVTIQYVIQLNISPVFFRGADILSSNRCSDGPEVNPSVVTTERVFEETIRQARTVTPIAASMLYSEHFCHRYTPRAVERYSGPWNVEPKNVVLVIGNQGEGQLVPTLTKTPPLIFLFHVY